MRKRYNPQLWRLEKRIAAGGLLDPADISVVVSGLDSSSLEDRLLACQALFSHSYSAHLTSQARSLAQRLCTEAAIRGDYHPNLVALLQMLPKRLLRAKVAFRRFALAAAHSSDADCRVNAMVLLFKLSAAGDRQAAGRLRAAAKDAHPMVRHNAQFFLGLPPDASKKKK